MRHGSGGVATAAIRLWAITGEEVFAKFARDCARTVSSRYTNKLWQDWGLAGFGELLLDAFTFFRDERYLQSAFYIAEGLLPHRVYRESGIVFPGSDLLKLSCDFGLGSAGIGSFLHRLLNPGTPRFFLLDGLIEAAVNRPEQEAVVSLSGAAAR
jgi:class III lanthionine synthetase